MGNLPEVDEKGQGYFQTGFLNALEEAWTRLKHTVKFSIGDMERGDEGPDWLRSQLPAEYRDVPLRHVRDGIARLNKGGKAGKTSRKAADDSMTMEKMANRLSHIFPPSQNGHSDCYSNYISGATWRDRAAQHKRECDFRCQICGRQRTGELLQIHHTNYDHLDGNERITDLLCVCGSPCHPIVDAIRRWGVKAELNVDEPFELVADDME